MSINYHTQFQTILPRLAKPTLTCKGEEYLYHGVCENVVGKRRNSKTQAQKTLRLVGRVVFVYRLGWGLIKVKLVGAS